MVPWWYSFSDYSNPPILWDLLRHILKDIFRKSPVFQEKKGQKKETNVH